MSFFCVQSFLSAILIILFVVEVNRRKCMNKVIITTAITLSLPLSVFAFSMGVSGATEAEVGVSDEATAQVSGHNAVRIKGVPIVKQFEGDGNGSMEVKKIPEERTPLPFYGRNGEHEKEAGAVTDNVRIEVRGDAGETVQVKGKGGVKAEVKYNPSQHAGAGVSVSVSEKIAKLSRISHSSDSESNGNHEVHIQLDDKEKAEISAHLTEKIEKDLEINGINEVELTTGEDGNVYYEVKAEKKVKIFGLFNIDAEIEVKVDAHTEEVVNVEEPWYMVFAFFG